MKKIILLITLIPITLFAFASPVQELMKLAETAFAKGDFVKARDYYINITDLESATKEQLDDARYNINICQKHINELHYSTNYNKAISLFNGKHFSQCKNICYALLKFEKYKKKTNRLINLCNDSIKAQFVAKQFADSIHRQNLLRAEYDAIIECATAYYKNKQYSDAIAACKKSFDSRFESLGESVPAWFERSVQIYRAQQRGEAITPEFASRLKNAICLGDVSNGIARIVFRNNRIDSTIYVSTSGIIKIEKSDYWSDDFHCGYLCREYGDRNGYYDTLGNFYSTEYISSLNFSQIGHLIFYVCEYSDGMAPFRMEDGKYGYLNSNFKVVIAPIYNYVTAFHEGFAFVRKKNKWTFIDKSGNELNLKFPIYIYDAYCNYHNGYKHNIDNAYFSDKLAGFGTKDKYIFINNKGRAILTLDGNEYNHSVINNSPSNNNWLSFSDGMIVCKDKSRSTKFGFMNKTGKIVIPIIYDSTYGFHEGIAPVKRDNKWTIIDMSGNQIIEPTFEDVSPEGFQEGLCAAKLNGKWGFIDKSGNWIISPIYDCPYKITNGSVGSFHEGFAAVELDGQLGYVDKFGNSTFDYQ